MLNRSVHISMPGAITDDFFNQLRVPSAGTLPRCTMVTDCAFMRLMALRSSDQIATRDMFFLALDASPQGGRNWFLVESTRIPRARLKAAVRAWRQLSKYVDEGRASAPWVTDPRLQQTG